MEITNSYTLLGEKKPSTVQEDIGIDGGITVKAILLKEGLLDYSDVKMGSLKVPSEELITPEVIEAMNGLPVFKGHPDKSWDIDQLDDVKEKMVGVVAKAASENIDGEQCITGVLRLFDREVINEVKDKQLNSGSLGYKCSLDGKTQKGIRPNHFALTNIPRDSGVVLYNSIQKDTAMSDNKTMLDAIQQIVSTEIKNSRALDKPADVTISRDGFEKIMNSFEKSLQGTKKGVGYIEVLNSISDPEGKLAFLSKIQVLNEEDKEEEKKHEDGAIKDDKAHIKSLEKDEKYDEDKKKEIENEDEKKEEKCENEEEVKTEEKKEVENEDEEKKCENEDEDEKEVKNSYRKVTMNIKNSKEQDFVLADRWK